MILQSAGVCPAHKHCSLQWERVLVKKLVSSLLMQQDNKDLSWTILFRLEALCIDSMLMDQLPEGSPVFAGGLGSMGYVTLMGD